MRVTNQMLTNNILLNINRNESALAEYETQLATGKKIQQASDDPIVAVRALRFRNTVDQIDQYSENAEDAQSWNNISEQAVSNITDVLDRVRELSVQGASDTLTEDDRTTIITEIEELLDQVVSEVNATYAGRYVFSGYKTNVPVSFTEASTDEYELTESFSFSELETTDVVVDDGTGIYTQVEATRFRLGYSDLESIDGTLQTQLDTAYTAAGIAAGATVTTMTSEDVGAYEPASGEVYFLSDTGELIFNSDDVDTMQAADPDTEYSATYEKHGFEKGDLVPDHYFDGENLTTGATFDVSSGDEEMNYQISYSQTITVNTMAYDVVSVDLQRDIEEIISFTESIADDDSLESELKADLLGDKFSELLGKLDDHLDDITRTTAEIGTKVSRLEMTISRLSEDSLNYTDIMSENEDIDYAEVYIKMASMETIYQASLSASSKVLQPTLLDFI